VQNQIAKLVMLRRPAHLASICIAGYLLIPSYPCTTALAGELYSKDDIALRWDNTFTYSTAFRLVKANAALLENPNADDGDRDFRPGVISNRFDLLSQFDFSKAWLGFDASSALWYDTVYHQKNDNNSPSTFNPISVPHAEFTHGVRALHGEDAELLNAFFYGNTEVGGMPLSFRIGRHSLLWGESLFFTDNGIAAGQAPVDDIKVLGMPNAYARDVYLPVAQASASIEPLSGLAVEAYYQFEWRKSRVPGVGSYFSTSDYFDVGGERYILAPGQYLFRDRDLKPPGSGQYGMAVRWSGGEIDYGLYALRFNAKDPEIYYKLGVAGISGNLPTVADPSIVDLSIGKVGTYDLVYPQKIEIYGASASGYLGSSNIAAEISGRRNMPLASVPLVESAGKTADGDKDPLYAVGDTIHAQISAITTFSHSGLWDSANLNAEFAANRVIHVTRNASALDPANDKFALAFRGTFEPTYFAILPNLDLTPNVGLGYNVSGNSSTDSYEKKGAGDFELGLTAKYRVVWVANIMMSRFLGNAARQPLADRDFVSFSVQRTF
jgi:hypothetical protein